MSHVTNVVKSEVENVQRWKRCTQDGPWYRRCSAQTHEAPINSHIVTIGTDVRSRATTALNEPRVARGCRLLHWEPAGGQSAARGWQHPSRWCCARGPRSRVASSPIPTRGLTIGERRVLLVDHRVEEATRHSSLPVAPLGACGRTKRSERVAASLKMALRTSSAIPRRLISDPHAWAHDW